MRVLAIHHHDEDRPGLVGEARASFGATIDLVKVDNTHPVPSLDGYDMLLTLGSKEAVYDPRVQAAWLNDELALITHATNSGVPVFGICFGAQELCVVAGGTVERAPEAELGWYDTDGADELSGPWFEYHFDRCLVPEHVDVWASSPRAVQAFAIGKNVGVQFHPEIDTAQLREWLEVDEGDARAFGHDLDTLLDQTATIEPDVRMRTYRLVERVLRHNGLLPS